MRRRDACRRKGPSMRAETASNAQPCDRAAMLWLWPFLSQAPPGWTTACLAIKARLLCGPIQRIPPLASRCPRAMRDGRLEKQRLQKPVTMVASSSRLASVMRPVGRPWPTVVLLVDRSSVASTLSPCFNRKLWVPKDLDRPGSRYSTDTVSCVNGPHTAWPSS